jgi:hypothetical protein
MTHRELIIVSKEFHHSSLFLNILSCHKKCLYSNLFNTDETLMKVTGLQKLRAKYNKSYSAGCKTIHVIKILREGKRIEEREASELLANRQLQAHAMRKRCFCFSLPITCLFLLLLFTVYSRVISLPSIRV